MGLFAIFRTPMDHKKPRCRFSIIRSIFAILCLDGRGIADRGTAAAFPATVIGLRRRAERELSYSAAPGVKERRRRPGFSRRFAQRQQKGYLPKTSRPTYSHVRKRLALRHTVETGLCLVTHRSSRSSRHAPIAGQGPPQTENKPLETARHEAMTQPIAHLHDEKLLLPRIFLSFTFFDH